MEIERKFLVKRGPVLDPASGTDLSQGYLAVADGAEVRVRSDGARHVLTVKRGQGLVRAEVEVVLDDDAFERLWPLTEGRRIVKRRTVVDVDGTAVEVDVYAGALAGLVVAEAEFATVEDSRRFVPPAWMGDEVTGRPEYAKPPCRCATLRRHRKAPADVVRRRRSLAGC